MLWAKVIASFDRVPSDDISSLGGTPRCTRREVTREDTRAADEPSPVLRTSEIDVVEGANLGRDESD